MHRTTLGVPREAGAREKQLQDSPVASLLGKRGKHKNAGAVSE